MQKDVQVLEASCGSNIESWNGVDDEPPFLVTQIADKEDEK